MPTIKNLTEDTAAVVWIQENDCCCIPCGIKFLTEAQKKKGGSVATSNHGICCVCGSETTVLPIRHYNYLNPIPRDNG